MSYSQCVHLAGEPAQPYVCILDATERESFMCASCASTWVAAQSHLEPHDIANRIHFHGHAHTFVKGKIDPRSCYVCFRGVTGYFNWASSALVFHDKVRASKIRNVLRHLVKRTGYPVSEQLVRERKEWYESQQSPA